MTTTKGLPGARALVIVFVLIIVLPGLGLVLGVDRATISESEMRELAPPPRWAWTTAGVAAWPRAFERYFDDHFAFRNRLIDGRAAVLWHGLRTSASDTVIAGKNGWLFYGADGGIDDWTQAQPFTPAELDVWRETLVRRQMFLSRRGIPFLFVIAPDKQMIYPEQMPESLRRLRNDYRADQLLAYMKAHAPTVPMLDLRPAVLAAKRVDLLYHRYDTHWNDRGALAGYQAIAAALQQWFPAVRPLQRDDFDTDPSVPSGDKTTMLGLTDRGKLAMPGLVLRRGGGYRVVEPATQDPYGEVGRLVTEHRDRSLPTAVVYRDSFAGRLIPFLSEHFSRAAYLWQNEFEFSDIGRDKPDIVIQEFVGRHFYTYVPYPGIIPD
jgi:alginate O-acetyltransferase complex protein AlgJ